PRRLVKGRDSWHSLRPVPPPLAVLAVLVSLAAPQLDLRATSIDPVATATGLHARVGPLDDWTIRVEDGAAPASVQMTLRSPDGRQQQRSVALTGTTNEDRSRELAASLALVIEQWDDPPPPDVEVLPPANEPPQKDPPQKDPPQKDPGPPPPAAAEPAAPVRGWLGLGPRLGVGRALVEGGLDLQGGAWLAREHVQPLASLGWSATARDGLSLHTLRIGAGLAIGAPVLTGRLWIGGHALTHAAWTRVHDAHTASVWSNSTEVGGLLQVRGGRWIAGVRTGVELYLPQLRAHGSLARIDRGPALWFIGLNFGFMFG
ncbi:MAG TPA: hypothetical protein VGB85_11435, partial [Nannocystis sp.]